MSRVEALLREITEITNADPVRLIDKSIKQMRQRNEPFEEAEKLRICLRAAYKKYPKAQARIKDFLSALNKHFAKTNEIAPGSHGNGGASK